MENAVKGPVPLGRTAGILLAAGASRRVGQLKQLLDWNGRSILRHTAGTLVAAGLDPVCVVLGHQRDRLASELADLGVHIIDNPDYDASMFSSVQCGLKALPQEVVGSLIALVDQPRIDSELIKQLVEDHLRSGAAVTLPRHQGSTGHPIVMGRDAIAAVLAAPPMATLREVLTRFADRTHHVDVRTDSVLRDIDTLLDYERERQGK
jgi:molybdenum cofactor cytidylyltransferase